jgi:hypothetical protein
MKTAVRAKACAAASCVVVVVAGGGCSTAVAGLPVAEKLPQGVLSPHFSPESDPLHVFRDGLFDPLEEPRPDHVGISGYRSQVAVDGTTSKVTVFDFNPNDGTWEQLTAREVVWSPEQAKWVTTDRTETLLPGPTGSRDRPTVKSVADYGTSYYTVSYDDLAGRPLTDGLMEGFTEGVKLPESASNAKFSPGARAYETTTTLIGPIYRVEQIMNANTGIPLFFDVYSCENPSPDCQVAATTLDQVAKQGGRVTNFAGTAQLEFDASGHATLRPVGTDIPFANLTYRLIKDDTPPRITLQAAHPDDEKKFGQAFAVDLKTFALYEYNGHVTIGSARPPYTTTTEFAGYNRIAINDLLGHWTPALPAVLP